MHSWSWVYKNEEGSTIKEADYLYFKIAYYYSRALKICQFAENEK